MASNYWYISHSFWLYVDGPTIAFSLFCLATFIHGIRGGALWQFMLSGLVFAIGMNTHIIVLLLVLPAFGLILLTERTAITRQLMTGIAGFCMMVVLAMLALSITAWLAFGNFWFYVTSVTTAGWVVSGGWHTWVLPFSKWILGATGFPMPIAVLFAAVVMFVREMISGQLRRDSWMLGYAVLLGACYVISDFVLGAGLLQHSYYFIYLWIPSFLLVGAIIARLSDALGRFTPFVIASSVVVGLGTLMLSDQYWRRYEAFPMGFTVATYAALAVLFLMFTAAIWLVYPARGLKGSIGILAIIAFTSIASASDIRKVDIHWQQQDFRTTIDAQWFIENQSDPNRRLLIWCDAKSPRSSQFIAINSVFVYAWSLLNDSMPNLTQADLERLKGRSTVVLLSVDQKDIDQALRFLRERGYVERVAASTNLGPDGKRFSMSIVETRAAADAEEVTNNELLAASPTYPGRIALPMQVDWDHAFMQAGSEFGSANALPITVQTPPQPYSYGALLPYKADFLAPGMPLRVRVRMRVLAGKIGIGLLNRDKSDVVQREFFTASSHPIVVTLSSRNEHETGPLLIQTADLADLIH